MPLSGPNTRNNKNKGNEPVIGVSPISANVTSNALRVFKEEIMDNFKIIIQSLEERLLQRFSDVSADIANLRAEVQSTKSKLVAVNKKCDGFDYNLNKLRATVSTLEQSLVASDFVIMGVPNNCEPAVVAGNLLSTLSCEQVNIQNAFRTHKAKESTKAVPIIVKLSSPIDRIKLFRALAVFRKNKNKQLTLGDLGLSGDTNIFVHECLTSLNREILKNSLHFKKTKLLVAAFSLRGQIFVRLKPDGNALKISSIDELNKVVGGANLST